MPIGHQLGLRLFLEGMEVPVIGANITVTANTPVVASIQVIATDKVLELFPRTVVHLFFYDFVEANSPLSDTPENASDQGTDEWNKRYKLLFMGEVQGLAFQKDTGSRMVVLNCVDFSNYWDTTYQYNFQGSLLGGRQHAAFIGANANYFTGPLGHGVGTIAALLNSKSVNFPHLKGLLAGVVHILEVIGGSYYGDTTFRGANDFTSIAELRLKILQQISAAEKDTSSARLFAHKAFSMWMNREMGSLGKLVTFRGLTGVLMQYIFHEIYPNPTALYQPKVTGLTKTKVTVTRLDQDPRTRALATDAKKLRSLLNSATDALGTIGKIGVILGERSALAKHLSDADASMAQARTTMFKISSYPGATLVNRYLQEIQDKMSKADYRIGQLKKKIVLADAAEAISALEAASITLTALLDKKTKNARVITYDKLDRVHNQILHPDIWFCSAPRCNVLFPELYSNFQWQRNFLREVSRMELQTTNEILGNDALFNGRYYAPNVADMRKGVRLSSRQFSRLTLAHELMTGIIPMFEKLSEANLFAMKSAVVKFKGAKVPYAQRSVNHQYFKHRFASRAMQCSGRFNPWFVAGFPAVILDRSMSADNLVIAGLPIAEQLAALDIVPAKDVTITRAMILRQLVPTQYFGSCIQLSHSVSQQGGNTSYAFQHARLHRESTEFLGVDKAVLNKVIGTAHKSTLVAGFPSNPPKVKNRGPRGGRITAVVDVTKQYPNSFLPLYGATSGTAKVKVGSRGDVTAVFGTSPQQSSAENFKAYRVSESYTRRARVNIDLPIEEAIRPPWIWDGWSNLKIGETYLQLLGTNSITDIEGVTSKKLLFDLVGADSRQALQEVEEGLAYGDKKKEEPLDTFLDRLTGTGDKKSLGGDAKNKKGKTSKAPAAQSKFSADTLLAIEKERTIENAVDYLMRVYSFMAHNGLDVANFLRHYTWRPVATMPEILGSENFNIQPKTKLVFGTGSLSDPGELLTEQKVEGEYVISGQEGFHSRAFGDVEDLFGLTDAKVRKVLGLSKDKMPAAAKKLDVRLRRRTAVREYVYELTQSRGLLG